MPKLTKTRDRGWRDLYQKQAWRNRAKHQLRIQPTCELCLARGLVVPAVICDHVEPHGGNMEKFLNGKLRSVCANCHASAVKFEQSRGFQRGCDIHGWPLDPKHPVYAKRPFDRGGGDSGPPAAA